MIDSVIDQQDFYQGIRNIQEYVIMLEQTITEQANQISQLEAQRDNLERENKSMREQLDNRPFWQSLFK